MKAKVIPEVESTQQRIVYIIGTYPDRTKTFVDREILEAKRAGLSVSIIAIRSSKVKDLSPPVQRLKEEITYLVPVSLILFARAHLRFLVTQFRSYSKTAFFLLTREHPNLASRFKTLLHFAGGVVAADHLRRSQLPNHVHAHFADGAAVIAMVISRLLAIPYSFTAHAYDIYRSPAFLEDKICGAKFVTTCTAYNKRHLEAETGRPIELVYHGLDFSAIREVGISKQKFSPPLILSVGRLTEKKGFAYLIRACASLKERGYDFRCEIVGDGPNTRELESLIRELGLSGLVKLIGALPVEEVFAKYSKASLFALPCCVTEEGDRDGIPNVILEAMAFALPVVSTDVSGVPEVVHHEKTGLLVESRNIEQLSSAIATLLTDPEQAHWLGQNAAEFVHQEFDIRRNVNHLTRLFSGDGPVPAVSFTPSATSRK